MNAENYTAAWNSLVEKYDRKYPLAREYLRQFFSLTAISTPATAEELRRLSNVTMETVRNLGSLGFPVDQWHMIIVHHLHGLLNEALVYEWNMEVARDYGDAPTTEHIVAFMSRHATAATGTDIPHQQSAVSVKNDVLNRKENWNRSNNSSRNSSRTPSVASSAQGPHHGSARTPQAGTQEPWKYPCGACRGNHKIYYCPEFTALSLKNRLELIKKNGLCGLCLQYGHTVTMCRDPNRCKQRACIANSDTNHNSLVCKHQVDQQLARPAHMEGAVGGRPSRSSQKRHGGTKHD